MFILRPYAEADYEDFVRIDAATQSTDYWGEADWRPIHPPVDAPSDANRYVAVHTDSSLVVGYGAVLLAEQANVDVMVHPAWQRRGIGTMLWEQMQHDLKAVGAVAVGPWVRAENTAGCTWLATLGFKHVNPDGPVQLVVAEANLKALAGVADRLSQRQIRITTLDAEQQATPNSLARFYDLYQEVEKDVPGYTPENRTTYEQCLRHLAEPGMQPETVFLAVHEGRYIGLSILGRRISPEDVRFAGGSNCLSQHLTGVRREYRKLGIALALKGRTILYARQHGFARILSNSDNPVMRAFNQKLGFRTGPWWVYHKALL